MIIIIIYNLSYSLISHKKQKQNKMKTKNEYAALYIINNIATKKVVTFSKEDTSAEILRTHPHTHTHTHTHTI